MNVFTTKAMVPRALKHGAANWVLQTSVYLFPPCAVMSSIPVCSVVKTTAEYSCHSVFCTNLHLSQVFSIIIKYNCVENGFSHKFAFVWGVLFPWIVALPLLYQPDALNQFITYSSLIFVSFTDFIVPWALYIVLQRKEAALVQRGIDPEALFALPSSSYNIQGEVRVFFEQSFLCFFDPFAHRRFLPTGNTATEQHQAHRC